MDFLEQENRLLKEEMATMQAKINEMAAIQTQVDELTKLVRTLRAAQNLPPPPPPINAQAEAGPSTIPKGRPWGVPISLGEVFHPYVSEAQMPTARNEIPTP